MSRATRGQEAVVKAGKFYPIHRPAPAFDQQSPVEIFETGIKVRKPEKPQHIHRDRL